MKKTYYKKTHSLRDDLKTIYKAEQCTDKKDCEDSICAIQSLEKIWGYRKSLVNRHNSLVKKRKHFETK